MFTGNIIKKTAAILLVAALLMPALTSYDIYAEQTDTVTAATDTKAAADSANSEIEKKWANKVMVSVEDHLNVRKEASKDSEIVGRMYPTSVAKVVKNGDEWTLIKSGNVKGYIKTSYCLFGMDAYNNMKSVCFKAATVTSSTLNIRKKASTSSAILKTVLKGTDLKYIKKSGTEWVKVKSGDVTGFVYKKYVDIGYNTTTALTIEEEKEESEEESTYIYPATDDEVALLAALVQCEAGSEPYDGKVAVAAVVLNRVKSPSYSSTISGVIYEPYQFGPARSGQLSSTLSSGKTSADCYNAVRDALSGSDPTGGLLHFNRNNGSGRLVIGHQMFY